MSKIWPTTKWKVGETTDIKKNEEKKIFYVRKCPQYLKCKVKLILNIKKNKITIHILFLFLWPVQSIDFLFLCECLSAVTFTFRFHYLEFMKCYSQNPPHLSKSQVYSKHTHKLERKVKQVKSEGLLLVDVNVNNPSQMAITQGQMSITKIQLWAILNVSGVHHWRSEFTTKGQDYIGQISQTVIRYLRLKVKCSG